MELSIVQEYEKDFCARGMVLGVSMKRNNYSTLFARLCECFLKMENDSGIMLNSIL